jgi:hypothetical protein
MAEELIVQLKVESKEARKSLDDFGKSLEKTQETASRAAKKPTKDWKGLADLFTGILPRNLQGVLRTFKSTERGVQRVSKSFKALKAAWASIGIGLLIIALEELVANWDAVSDAIGLSSEEQRRNEKIAESQKQAYVQLNTETESYIAILQNQASTEQSVANAVDVLNRSLGNVIDTEASREEQLKQAQAALEAKQQAEQAEIKVQELRNAVMEDSMTLTDDLTDLQTGLMTAFRTPKQIAAAQVERLQQNKDLKEELEAQVAVLAEQTKAYKDLQEQAKQTADERRKEKTEAESASRAAEQAAKRRADAREKIEQETADFLEELGKTEEERQILRLERKQERERNDAQEAQLSAEEYTKLLQKQAVELEQLEDQIDKRLQERVANEQAKLDEALRTREEQQVYAVNERYDKLVALAEEYGRDTIELEAQRQRELDDLQKQTRESAARQLQEYAELERELELLSMDERTAQYERMRDEVQAAFDERTKIAQEARDKRIELADQTGESQEQIEREYQDTLTAIAAQGAAERAQIDNKEAADHKAIQQQKFDAVQDFVASTSNALNSLQDLRDAQTESAIIDAKLRGASDEEIARIQEEAAVRERRLAITQVLLQQGMALANAIQGATAAAAATTAAAPITLPIYIATMVGAVVAGFAQIKSIMNEAKAANIPSPSAGGGGGGSRPPQNVLDPNLAEDFSNEFTGGSGQSTSFRSYVVLSDVQGQESDYGNIVQNASL